MVWKKLIILALTSSMIASMAPLALAEGEDDEEVQAPPLIDISSDDVFEDTPTEFEGPPVIVYDENSRQLDASGNPIPTGEYTSDSQDGEITETTESENEENPENDMRAFTVGFSDVMHDDWFYTPVTEAYSLDLVSGVSDTEFEPGSAVTGGQLLMMLFRAAGNKVSEQTTDNWYDEAVSWAASNGIIDNEIGWEFDPNADLTREQMMVLIYNYFKYKEKVNSSSTDLLRFEDGVEVSDYAQLAVSWLVATDIIVGDGNRIRPKDSLSRAETSVILVKVFNMQSQMFQMKPDPNMVGRPEDNKYLYPDGVPAGTNTDTAGEGELVPFVQETYDINMSADEDFVPVPPMPESTTTESATMIPPQPTPATPPPAPPVSTVSESN